MAEWHRARPYLPVFFSTSRGGGFSVILTHFEFRKLKVMIIIIYIYIFFFTVCTKQHDESETSFPTDILNVQKNSLLLVGNKYLLSKC